jgi:hypothetical protein
LLNGSAVQTALITALKADATLVAALGGSDEIREDEWPGTDWVYPNVRVALNLMVPTTTGNCHLTSWTVTFSTLVFTQPTSSVGVYDVSSDQCNQIMNDCAAALFGSKIESAGVFFAETAANITGQNAPVSLPPPGGWRGEVLWEMRLKEV